MPRRESASALLEKKLAALRLQEREQLAALKLSFHEIKEELNPAGFAKSYIRDLISAPDRFTRILNFAIGTGAGLLGKKIFAGKSNNPLKKWGGNVIGFLTGSTLQNIFPLFRKKSTSAS